MANQEQKSNFLASEAIRDQQRQDLRRMLKDMYIDDIVEAVNLELDSNDKQKLRKEISV